jgi:hypothetical protein
MIPSSYPMSALMAGAGSFFDEGKQKYEMHAGQLRTRDELVFPYTNWFSPTPHTNWFSPTPHTHRHFGIPAILLALQLSPSSCKVQDYSELARLRPQLWGLLDPLRDPAKGDGLAPWTAVRRSCMRLWGDDGGGVMDRLVSNISGR